MTKQTRRKFSADFKSKALLKSKAWLLLQHESVTAQALLPHQLTACYACVSHLNGVEVKSRI